MLTAKQKRIVVAMLVVSAILNVVALSYTTSAGMAGYLVGTWLFAAIYCVNLLLRKS